MEKETAYGKIYILEQEQIFERLAKEINELKEDSTVGLTGGSTPKAFYKWAVNNNAISKKKADQLLWMTSDERCVPLSSDDSNFGNADRMLLIPIGASKMCKKPWATEKEPRDAAEAMNWYWNEHRDPNKCFDLCVLGMGDDCHTASLFPGSSLLDTHTHEGNDFAAIEVPEKGWRLTVTPAGLTRCKKVVVVVTGSSKAEALKEVLEGNYNPKEKPSQVHKAHAAKTFWFIDKEAAALLS